MGGEGEIEEKRKKKNTPEGAEKAPQKNKKEKHTGRCGEKEKDEKLIGIKSGGLHFFTRKNVECHGNY